MGKVETILVPVFDGNGPGYDEDYCAWASEQGRRIRLLRIPGVDVENVADEIEGLMRSDKRQIASRVQVLITHLLKWRYQNGESGKSWRLTILEQRRSIKRLVEESPSLRSTIAISIEDEYGLAAGHASLETKLPESVFPSTCEWTAEQIMDLAFFPEPGP